MVLLEPASALSDFVVTNGTLRSFLRASDTLNRGSSEDAGDLLAVLLFAVLAEAEFDGADEFDDDAAGSLQPTIMDNRIKAIGMRFFINSSPREWFFCSDSICRAIIHRKSGIGKVKRSGSVLA